MKWRRNIAENFNRLSRVHESYRQTTDGRMTTYSEHEHEFTFAKNIGLGLLLMFHSNCVHSYIVSDVQPVYICSDVTHFVEK